MQNFIRTLLGRLRGAVSDRRRAARFGARLFFSISLLEEKPSNGGVGPMQPLVGHTRDLSESGIALIVPSLRIGTGYLNEGNATLRLMLDLPTRRLEIHVVPVRSYQLGEHDKEQGYFIGAKITYISDDDFSRYKEYLRKLGSPH
ncbi:MAG: hypothetical protein DMF64_06405 [Acidobacteria bacterium]|nr:MAG: hypothetical protein DMF64_06405 [Acidobacteriota bacterium]